MATAIIERVYVNIEPQDTGYCLVDLVADDGKCGVLHQDLFTKLPETWKRLYHNHKPVRAAITFEFDDEQAEEGDDGEF